MAIVAFFVGHWALSVFFQSFFLHRYGAHRMFTMSPRWEKFFYACTWLTQGSSYLQPRAYALLHRMHHSYSDTARDPHSPNNHRNVFEMMWVTKERYFDFVDDRVQPEPRFEGGYPQWPALEKIASSWGSRLTFVALYTAFYFAFATSWWMWLLLPMHYVMGPLHGAIVNWCGHRYGYRNFASRDDSRNTLPFDFLTAGELFQNNHHRHGMSPNFAQRWFEIDPTYLGMRVLALFRIIELKKQPKVVRPTSPLDVVDATSGAGLTEG